MANAATVAKKNQTGVLEGVFVYAKIAQADKKYQSNDTEYSISVVVDKATAKNWNKSFPKQKAKEFEPSEFETKCKLKVPEHLADEDEIFTITLKKPATKDGKDYTAYRPRAFVDMADERVDITESRLIANGSKGKVSYRITTNDFGTFAQLNNILMDEDGFVEYKSGFTPGSEFGEAKPVKVEAASESATKARKAKDEAPAKESPKAKAKQEEPEEDFEDCPF